MSGYPGFGVLLTRLLEHRGLAVADLPGCGTEERELRAVLNGQAPGPALLSRLAPALGLHVADLYVVAGIEVPQELAPLDASAGPLAARLAVHAGKLPEKALVELLRYARSLPQHDRAEPFPAPRRYEQYPPGFGGILVRMLATRNLDWLSSVRVLHEVSLGRVYWSAATVGAVGRGHKKVSAALLHVFAAALGIPAGDLAALGGMTPPGTGEIRLNPAAGTVAALVWEARRLTAGQVKLASAKAGTMLEH
jgi:hypothetical protein